MRFLVSLPLLVLAGCAASPVRETKSPASKVPKTLTLAEGELVSLADLEITLPSNWKVADFSNSEWKSKMAKLAKGNATVSGMMSMMEEASRSGFIKLVAFDLATAGSGFANNINVIVTPGQGLPFAKLVAANDEQLRTIATKGHEPKLERKMLTNGQWAILSSHVPTGPNGKDIAIKTCLALHSDKAYTITFSTLPGKEDQTFGLVEPVLGSVKFK